MGLGQDGGVVGSIQTDSQPVGMGGLLGARFRGAVIGYVLLGVLADITTVQIG